MRMLELREEDDEVRAVSRGHSGPHQNIHLAFCQFVAAVQQADCVSTALLFGPGFWLLVAVVPVAITWRQGLQGPSGDFLCE